MTNDFLSTFKRRNRFLLFQVSLQAERMARQAELRRRDLQLLRAERQRRLCEDIISTQRRIIEGIQATNIVTSRSLNFLFFPLTRRTCRGVR